jgi:hypothetical protein
MLAGLLLIAGCEVAAPQKQPEFTRSFFNRTINYTLTAEAKESMAKLESLIELAQKLEPPIPDDIILPLYRDADIDRNHFITKDEAEVFSDSFILKFEDSLGKVKYSQID